METDIQKVVSYFFELKGWDDMPKEFYRDNGIKYGRYVKPAKQLIELCDGDTEEAKRKLKQLAGWAKDRGLDYTIETAHKKWLDLCQMNLP